MKKVVFAAGILLAASLALTGCSGAVRQLDDATVSACTAPIAYAATIAAETPEETEITPRAYITPEEVAAAKALEAARS